MLLVFHHMRSLLPVAALCALATAASAGPLGGFADDQRSYLRGQDKICEPLDITAKKMSTQPVCRDADTSEVAAGTYRAGTKQTGASASYTATARGSTLTVTARNSAEPLVEWTSINPIEKVVGVYTSDHNAMIAVEYDARFGGRTVSEVIVFRAPMKTTTSTDAPIVATDAPPEDSDAIKKLLKKAIYNAKRYAHAKALEHYRKVLELDADHSEARYGAAKALAGKKKNKDAIAELEILATSTRADAIEYLVEARFDKAFKKIRSDEAFRAAVGLDAAKGVRPLYDRLVGFGGKWEQAGQSCERARVNLTLERLSRDFSLRVRSRCSGSVDDWKFAGSWSHSGADVLELAFPNPNAGEADDIVSCQIATCDDTAEDCIRCDFYGDAIELRTVRR